jgi:RHS repeat-associated protein
LNHFKFTDLEHDSESNLEHTWFRQLSSTHGRWLTPDPYMGSMDLTNPQSLNRYAYVMNDPMDLTDPLGLDPPTCALIQTAGAPGQRLPTDDFMAGHNPFLHPLTGMILLR